VRRSRLRAKGGREGGREEVACKGRGHEGGRERDRDGKGHLAA